MSQEYAMPISSGTGPATAITSGRTPVSNVAPNHQIATQTAPSTTYRPAKLLSDGRMRTSGSAGGMLPNLHVLVGRKGRVVDPGDRVLGDLRAHDHQRAEVHDRREQQAIEREMLEVMEDRLALMYD